VTVRRRVRDLVLRDVEVDGSRVDVVLLEGRAVVGGASDRRSEVVEGNGGALLPGLHDHHLHLLATAAEQRSVRCGPPAVTDLDGLADALQGTGWARGTGYHESVAGALDRTLLDRAAPARPVRVQHRTGGQWVLNTRALEELGVVDAPDGVLWRGDPRLPHDPEWPDVAAVGAELADMGVLGVTDATPDVSVDVLEHLVACDMPQRVLALGAPDSWEHDRVAAGPMKVLLGDEDLDADRLRAALLRARAAGRRVAVHTVTRESLVLALALLDEVGVLPGDRLEHAAVVPPDLLDRLRPLTVVTQPALAAVRATDHERDVDPRDLGDLWRYGSLLTAGIRAVASSDAPYGPLDPWEVIRAARDRRTEEAVPPRRVLDGLLSPLHDPGGPPAVVDGSADLVLLHVPLAEALSAPSREHVRLVLAGR
jgi:predicted amidohydrolase YtcJ